MPAHLVAASPSHLNDSPRSVSGWTQLVRAEETPRFSHKKSSEHSKDLQRAGESVINQAQEYGLFFSHAEAEGLNVGEVRELSRRPLLDDVDEGVW